MMLIICQSLYPCAGVLYIMCYIMVLATTVVGVQPLRTGCMGVCLCQFYDSHCACISTVKMSQSLSLPHTSIYCTLFIISPSPTLSLSLSFHDTYLAKIMYQSCFYNKQNFYLLSLAVVLLVTHYGFNCYVTIRIKNQRLLSEKRRQRDTERGVSEYA